MSSETPPWPLIESPLDDVNGDFHTAYDVARGVAEEEAPVLIFLNDRLVVHLRGERHEFLVTPRLYHLIKSASHAPIALYSALYLIGDRAIDPASAQRLLSLRQHCQASLQSLADEASPLHGDLHQVLASTIALIDHTLAQRQGSRVALAEFARSSGPPLLRLIDCATGVQLDALHARVDAVLAEMTPGERGRLQVVVAGPHQARERSVAMQYFRKRLREPEHTEERVAYAENAADEGAALALVGTRRFDRALAGAFFGDERRLQRDLLGDAAAARLSRLEFPPAEPVR
jgi:hypothetical protein